VRRTFGVAGRLHSWTTDHAQRRRPIQGRRFPTLRKLVIVCVPAIVALAGGYLLRQLDPRPYPVSMTGLPGFAKYLAGDYGAAAHLVNPPINLGDDASESAVNFDDAKANECHRARLTSWRKCSS